MLFTHSFAFNHSVVLYRIPLCSSVRMSRSEHDGCQTWSRNCLPWVHPQFLVGFVLLV